MKTKVEIWSNHDIRFVEKEPGDWWAVAKDVTDALELKQTTRALNRINPENYTLISNTGINNGINKELNIINELGIYELVFASRKKEAADFRQWVYSMLKSLRQASGLEAFQVFRMLDKEHQKEAMKRLQGGLHLAGRVDYIKANTIVDKAISTKRGSSRMIKKSEMPPEWLPERQPILDDTVDLMTANDRFGLGLSVSGIIYKRHCG